LPQPAVHPERVAFNCLRLSAALLGSAPLRYTPAGVPALDVLLQHQSQQAEGGQVRSIEVQIKAIAFGAVAEALQRHSLGVAIEALGFLAHTRNGKGLVFHIQEFKPV